MFFLRRQVKKCKIHKKLKLRMNEDGVKCQMGTEFSGKLDWLNLTILAVFINPIMCYDLEK